jgi:class 3 adenylate cyclase
LPATERIVRQRLVAIPAADALGYSRLMALDDRATVLALDIAREIFRDRVVAQGGRIVDMAGDSVLAIFDSAVGALRAALEAQQRLAAADVGVTPSERMRFRIGVHLGDVIEKDDGTVYGDGLNIAARLEELAEPRGVAVSQSIEASINHRLNVRFVGIGAQQVKNIARPIRAFRCEPMIGSGGANVRVGGDEVSATAEAVRSLRRRRARFRWFAISVALIGAGLVAFSYVRVQFVPDSTRIADRRMTFGFVEFVAHADDALAKQVAKETFRQMVQYQFFDESWLSPKADLSGYEPLFDGLRRAGVPE